MFLTTSRHPESSFQPFESVLTTLQARWRKGKDAYSHVCDQAIMNVNSLSNLWIHLNSKALKMWKVHQVSWRSDFSGHPACFAWFAEVNQQTWSQSIGQKEIKGACLCSAKQKAQANDFTSQNTSSDASEHWSSDPVTIDSRGEFYELYANQVLALESHKIGRAWSGMLMGDVYRFDRSVKSFSCFIFHVVPFLVQKLHPVSPCHPIVWKAPCSCHRRSGPSLNVVGITGATWKLIKYQVLAVERCRKLWEVSNWSFPCSINLKYIHSIHFFCINGTKKKQKILSGTQCLQFTCIFEILKHIETTERIWKPW